VGFCEGAATAEAAGSGRYRGPAWPQAENSHPAATLASKKGLGKRTCFSRSRLRGRASEGVGAKLGFGLNNIPQILLAMTTPSPLTDTEFRTLSSALLTSIEAQIDHWLQHDVVDIDAIRSGGVLDLTFPNASHIIINTQPPLLEIWLAARSGGFHYRYRGGAWYGTKDGGEFIADLTRCASEQAGQELQFV
jgi:CyaY protein